MQSPVQLELTAFDPRHLNNFRHKPRQTVRFLVHNRDQFALLG